ncbi:MULTISPECIES: 7-carboxy-7-deazaguanine synthase QueE [Shewanella]|uniref:7-carboxy-7-deazaguanine synthase QueE n=1 Tax=Shewanella TaxID=22 RepID=UPI00167A55AE|nr:MULTISPECIES: 7-carboxy-7-deazaguanine synthase QueE [Shewanella]MBO1272628.1 7-carboxy-7-deazaguanine synthase QueE [Shewanella sp. 4t3-1-2LB]MCL2905440.1 7-carboxy-7-deazaguanine synthase QueE [Shewanella fodinae]GGY91083.1 7-carboxy-7-deazaguanine synthase [Shewanella fodinae]
MLYPVNEVFETIQGEGVNTGLPSIFVRLQGCPVGCPWCDTRQTWEQFPENEVTPEQVLQTDGSVGRWAWYNSAALLAAFTAKAFSAKHVVLTGGEPCLFDLTELTQALNRAGYSTQLETSGTFEVKCSDSTWVTVSPKIGMKGGLAVKSQALKRANEIKHPVATSTHIEQLDALLAGVDLTGKVVCLQPISQKSHATALAIKVCIARNWRLSVQTHKYLQID